MRARLKCALLLAVTGVVCFLAGSVLRHGNANQKGWYVPYTLLWGDSIDEIVQRFQTQFASVSVREVSTPKTRFVFLRFYSYRGIGFCTLYCYEEVEVGWWLLRGVFPLKGAGEYDEHNREHAGEMTFRADGEAIQVIYENDELFVVKSLRKNHVNSSRL
jgi:hypothetical protein